MSKLRKLELLAPAKDLACGMAAIDHGADAVYIGGSEFGARVAARNSVEDIARLCDYAHSFGARIYATVNTLIYDQELDGAYALLKQLAQAGVDAVLVQDMAAIELMRRVKSELGYAPALHASTQCDVRSADKVKWLYGQGFSRVVLARELSLHEIEAIHNAAPQVELEAFVHGALCVSYSGECYASQYCFGRSANRGACAQFCRMKFDLLDADGTTIERSRYLLSLKDMNRLGHLEELARAGVCSFKIEGRLKDISYVKNVVSAYSRQLDELVRRHPADFCRASLGRVDYQFKPDLRKTFNRGFTTYFLHGRQPDMASFDTPKALGEMVGRVKEIRGESFTVAGLASFSNGDGLCFINDDHELEGFRVNRAEGGRLFPFKMPPRLKAGMVLYRNQDVAFEKTLGAKTANRRIALKMTYGLTDDGFRLAVEVADPSATDGPFEALVTTVFAHQKARLAQTDNIRMQLSKLGATIFECPMTDISIEDGADQYFMPSSLLADLRRRGIAQLQQNIAGKEESRRRLAGNDHGEIVESKSKGLPKQPMYDVYPYLYNVANHLSSAFYHKQGLEHVSEAFELHRPDKALVMQCRYCLRYALGRCVRHGGQAPEWHEPLTLRLGDGRRFRLEFRCDLCQMNIYAE